MTDETPLDDILTRRIAEFEECFPIGPIPRLLKVGPLANAAIRAAVPSAPPNPFASPIDRLFGIDIFIDPTLDPDQWQVKDQHGNVMHEGRL